MSRATDEADDDAAGTPRRKADRAADRAADDGGDRAEPDDDDDDDGDDGDDGDDDDGDDGDDDDGESLSPRHVKAAAHVLSKEARKILRKHGGRIAAAPAKAIQGCIDKIEAMRSRDDLRGLERQAKRLDELLHRHASFARKSALRETAENIAIAVIIALGLRSCLYEPFKIPSGSMMPTLRSGDHIFVNKFTYGIQIPFTTTVVGESLGEIERGDVIVFRYPIDESEDFIKRVVGLPGDEVRVLGREVAVKRAGESEFVVLPHKRLQARCFDEAGVKEIANCTLYEETAGDKTYVVRYVLTPEERGDAGSVKPRTWKVPERHLLVMGDNRNRSHDSLAWTVQVEAVRADRIVTSKDLRDLTEERSFEMRHRSDDDRGPMADPHTDRVTYTASHRAERYDLGLSIWRDPTLSAAAVFDTLAARHAAATTPVLHSMVQGAKPALTAEATQQVAEASAAVSSLSVGLAEGVAGGKTRSAVVALREPNAVLHLSCGEAVCSTDAALAQRLAEVILGFTRDPEAEARLLLQRSDDASYSAHWSGRHNPKDHVFERRFSKAGESAGPRAQVRLRAFRDSDEGVELMRDAALAQAGGADEGTRIAASDSVVDAGPDAWLVDGSDAWTYVAADHARDFVVVLSCGKAVCRGQDDAFALATTVTARVPAAASDRRRMVDLIGPKDVDGLPEVPVAPPELYEYDDVQLEATIKDEAYRFDLEAWFKPESGLPAKLAAVRDTVGGLTEDASVADGGYYGSDVGGTAGHTFVFALPKTDVVMRVTCNAGLCPDKATAQALAQRAATTGLDTSAFIDPDAERPKPFVPRGNVKGRAERIWLPLSRFWLAIR
ncbi:MAG: signal peptidase I [Myxococcota bacterium]